MDLVIRMEHPGGPEVLKAEPVVPKAPGPGQALIRQEAVGVNYLDVTQRSGAVPIALPSGLGLEAAGRVTAIGPGVDHVEVGDRVAYILGPIGGYASARLYPAERLIRLPDKLSFEEAATVLFKGITAHYLLHTTYPVARGAVVLLYGAAGALGQIMAPWAKALGAFVIGVVSKEASVKRARAAGCDAVLVWGMQDIPGEVAALTNGRKADVVYDGVGKVTFDASLDALRPRGVMVSIGASSGAPGPVAVATLNAKGSLFLTRPGLAAHATDLDEYRRRAAAVFAAVSEGVFTPSASQVFPLADAAEAHAWLEGGKATGAVLLKP